MIKKLEKVAVLAVLSCAALQAFWACGDSGSSISPTNNNGAYSANSTVSSSSIIVSSAGVASSSSETNAGASLTGIWHYYIGGAGVDIKWGSNPVEAPVAAENTVGDGVRASVAIGKSCNGGICGMVSLKPSVGDEWNALLIQYFISPDDWENGHDVSALPGICLRYNVVYSGEVLDYANAVQVMWINLEAADNIVSSRDYNAKYRYDISENLITGNKGDSRVLNLAWSDFVWPTSDTFYANEPYTLEQAVANLHGIQVRFAQYEEHDVTILFNIQKIGVYGTCAD